ncbi:MAG: flagellar basal body P-ring protein FlgI, partial [Nitrospinota bacterium]
MVGLNKTGDQVNNGQFSAQTLINMLEKLGTTVDIRRIKDIRTKNSAAVMVTAVLPPFARQGNKIDVVVSSLGDATSLAGGTLLLTPLRGANGLVYAVAQGPVSVGGAFAVAGRRSKKSKNHSTSGKIPGGALVERGVEVALQEKEFIDIQLNQSDFTTVFNISNAINGQIGDGNAAPLDSGTVRVQVPDSFKGKIVEMISKIELIEVNIDQAAKVVLDERTGTVVIGQNVKLHEAAISHGSLTITIKTVLEPSQPPPLSGGTTVLVPREELKVEENNENVLRIPATANITELVKALNVMGVSPRDLIAIFQSLKAAGALQAELIII